MKDIFIIILAQIKQLPLNGKDLFFLLAGLIGSIVAGFKKKLNKLQFITSLMTGVFVSWIIGTFLGNYLNLSPEVIYAFCALAGHFSDEILRQFGEVVGMLGTWIKILVEKWIKK